MRKPLEILLVEDNEGDIEMTQRVFRDGKSACNISVANDGSEALDCFSSEAISSTRPRRNSSCSISTCPAWMAKDSLELMKKEQELKSIPVIMLTSSQSPKDIQECYERHASCYVVKPFNGQEYADALRRIVDFWSGLGRLPYSS